MQIGARKIGESVSFEEYLLMEDAAAHRSEYHDGEIYAMSGGTLNHSKICSNANFCLESSLRAKNSECLVFESNAIIRIEDFNRGVYPDLSVVCEDPVLYKGYETVYTNPLLIVEVLSKSSEDYDRGTKFKYYRSLPSFIEYVLIAQKTPKVESWYKQEENVWRISGAQGLDGELYLYSLDVELKLSDLYRLVKFDSVGDRSE